MDVDWVTYQRRKNYVIRINTYVFACLRFKISGFSWPCGVKGGAPDPSTPLRPFPLSSRDVTNEKSGSCVSALCLLRAASRGTDSIKDMKRHQLKSLMSSRTSAALPCREIGPGAMSTGHPGSCRRDCGSHFGTDADGRDRVFVWCPRHVGPGSHTGPGGPTSVLRATSDTCLSVLVPTE